MLPIVYYLFFFDTMLSLTSFLEKKNLTHPHLCSDQNRAVEEELTCVLMLL